MVLPQFLFIAEIKPILLSKTSGSRIDARVVKLFTSIYTNTTIVCKKRPPPQYAKTPQLRSQLGSNVRSDIQVYLDVLELVHSAAGGEGVEVLFCILNRDSEGSETLVIP